MGLIAGIPPYQEWVERSQHAFPKVASACRAPAPFLLSHFFNCACLTCLLLLLWSRVILNAAMNRTLLLPLLSRCQQLLEDRPKAEQWNATVSSSTAVPPSSTGPVAASTASTASFRETYDNAYFYILFVMVFYSFLAMTLFKCVGSDEEKKDPYEEFMNTGRPSASKLEAGRIAEKFFFEEESGI